MNKVTVLLFLIALFLNGCSSLNSMLHPTYKQPIVLNNKSDKNRYHGHENRYLIAVLENTKEGRETFVKEFKKSLEKTYKHRKNNLKYRTETYSFDECQYPTTGIGISAVQAYNRMRYTCRELIHHGNYIVQRERKVYVSGADITTKDLTKKAHSKDPNILFKYRISIHNRRYENYTFFVKIYNNKIIIFKTSNIAYPFTYITEKVEKILEENKEIKPVKLKYFKY